MAKSLAEIHREQWGHAHEQAPVTDWKTGRACLRCGFPKVAETMTLATEPHGKPWGDEEFLCRDCWEAIGRAAGWLP